MLLKSYAMRTDQGPFLEINEDDLDIDVVNGLYLLFDGFGGSGIGDVVVKELKKNIKENYTRIAADPDSTLPFFYSPRYLIEGNAMINSMHFAHNALAKSNKEKEMDCRGGASVLAISQAEKILTVGSVGNCMAYLYRQGYLEVVSAADTVELFNQGEAGASFLTVPASAFGLFNTFHMQTRELKMQDEDTLLLLTDGAYSRLTKKEIKFILESKDHSNSEKLDQIFKLSNDRGNRDNQSAIILNY